MYIILEINKHMNLITFQPHNYYEHGHIISIKLKSKFMSVHIHFIICVVAVEVGVRRVNDKRIYIYIYHNELVEIVG